MRSGLGRRSGQLLQLLQSTKSRLHHAVASNSHYRQQKSETRASFRPLLYCGLGVTIGEWMFGSNETYAENSCADPFSEALRCAWQQRLVPDLEKAERALSFAECRLAEEKQGGRSSARLEDAAGDLCWQKGRESECGREENCVRALTHYSSLLRQLSAMGEETERLGEQALVDLKKASVLETMGKVAEAEELLRATLGQLEQRRWGRTGLRRVDRQCVDTTELYMQLEGKWMGCVIADELETLQALAAERLGFFLLRRLGSDGKLAEEAKLEKEAMALLERGTRVRRGASAEGAEKLHSLLVLERWGREAARVGRKKEAEKALRRALAEAQRLDRGDRPHSVVKILPQIYCQLGQLLVQSKRVQEGLGMLKAAIHVIAYRPEFDSKEFHEVLRRIVRLHDHYASMHNGKIPDYDYSNIYILYNRF